MKILVVDDEEDILQLTKKFLEKKQEKLSVETASSGNEALEMFEDNPYDAIVSDYKMPEMDGLELLKKIRDKGIGTLFYILTGKGDRSTSYEALNLGANGYFPKSIVSEKGFDKLGEILVDSIEKKKTMTKNLIAWITVNKEWRNTNDKKFEYALKKLGKIIGFKISEIEKSEISPEKENIMAYTENYQTIPKAKAEKAEKWKEIITDEPEVVDAGFKSEKKIQRYTPQPE